MYHPIAEVADRLSVATITVRREIERGNLYAVKVGRLLRVSDDELSRYIDAQRHQVPTKASA